MIRAVLSFFADTDRHLQRWFDACVHALMRATGCTKGDVRHAVNMVADATMVVAELAAWRFVVAAPMSLAIDVTWIVFCVVCTRIELRWDREAERTGLLSRADDFDPAFKKAVLVANIVRVLVDPMPWGWRLANATAVENSVGRAAVITFSVAWLLHAYLVKTPPRPPAQRRRAPVRTVPQGA